jgi:hypothetical protein
MITVTRKVNCALCVFRKKTAHWLLGQWEAQSDGGTLTETWKKANDSTYNGQFIS